MEALDRTIPGNGARRAERRYWMLSPSNFLTHIVDATPDDDSDAEVAARCGHVMPRRSGLDEVLRGSPCALCVLASSVPGRGGMP